MEKGKFYVFEGLDRSGKSTQVDILAKQFDKVNCYKFPNRDTTTGKVINDILQGRITINQQALFFLFLSNISEQVENIKENLENGITVIADRYHFSTIAYGVANGMDVKIWDLSIYNFPVPDKVFYINCSVEVISKRKGFGDELFEKREFLSKAKGVFDVFNLINSNWTAIDSEQSVENVSKNILSNL